MKARNVQDVYHSNGDMFFSAKKCEDKPVFLYAVKTALALNILHLFLQLLGLSYIVFCSAKTNAILDIILR